MSSAQPIRFCLLTTFYPPWNFGGDGIQVERLAHALADRGHQVTVVCSPAAHRVLARRRCTGPAPYPGVEVLPIADNLASLVGEYVAGRPLGAKRQLEDLLERDFDVLHFHNPSLLGAPGLLAMGEGVKLYTAHEQWLLCPSHTLWKRGRVCESPPCRSCEVAHLRPPQLWRHTALLERSLAHLDAMVLPSRSSARLHERFAPLVRQEVINHFVPTPPVAPPSEEDAESRDGDRPYFLYVGRLEPIKGVGTLVEAFRRRRAEDLVIAGAGSLAQRLRRKAARSPQVRFTGWLPAERLDPLYRGALAVVVPTLGHEVFPLVVVEALARGTPTVVHNFGALAEIIEETCAGIGYGSSRELDAALDRIASDEPLRAELGRRGRVACAERYSVENHLSRYLSLIADLAGGRGDDALAARAEAAARAAGADDVPVRTVRAAR